MLREDNVDLIFLHESGITRGAFGLNSIRSHDLFGVDAWTRGLRQ